MIFEELTEKKVYCKVTNCSAVNLRQEPSPISDILAVLQSGTELEKIDDRKAERKGYAHVVTSAGVEGFIQVDYLEIQE